jgi:glycolate oxidase
MIAQPPPKPDVLARRDDIVAGLRAIVPGEGVIADATRLKPYETDGLTIYKQPPLAVVLPETTEQVAAILRLCHRLGVRVIPRGAGTSLSGGALPLADAVVVGMMRMNRILDIDYADRCATVQARPLQPARLHDRRQCRHELRRRALPEIRRHRKQSAWPAHRHHRG